jgi:hypothetical protein
MKRRSSLFVNKTKTGKSNTSGGIQQFPFIRRTSERNRGAHCNEEREKVVGFNRKYVEVPEAQEQNQ